MLGFVTLSEHMNSAKIGSIVVSKDGHLWEVISQFCFGFRKVHSGSASVVE